jgi:short-subunit dehydrogenase
MDNASPRTRLMAGITAGIGAGIVIRTWRTWRGLRALRDQVVVVTGGSRGLGLLLAHEFAAKGARVVICARDAEELARAREELASGGADVIAVPCDIRDRDQVVRLVDEAHARWGRIDVLVNNAGIITVGPLEEQTLTDFENSMSDMFWGMVYTTFAVLPEMRARHAGHIVNITSIGGKIAVPHLLSYEAAKFAAVGFSEGLRAESRKDGIAVTTVIPGLMRTGSFVDAYFKGHNREEYAWFSLLSSLPLVSINAWRAARQIVRATARGESELIITIQAQVAVRLHGLFPGLTSDILGVVNRFLPAPGGIGRARVIGQESESAISTSSLTALGRAAARQHNEYAPQTPPDKGEGS